MLQRLHLVLNFELVYWIQLRIPYVSLLPTEPLMIDNFVKYVPTNQVM